MYLLVHTATKSSVFGEISLVQMQVVQVEYRPIDARHLPMCVLYSMRKADETALLWSALALHCLWGPLPDAALRAGCPLSSVLRCSVHPVTSALR